MLLTLAAMAVLALMVATVALATGPVLARARVPAPALRASRPAALSPRVISRRPRRRCRPRPRPRTTSPTRRTPISPIRRTRRSLTRRTASPTRSPIPSPIRVLLPRPLLRSPLVPPSRRLAPTRSPLLALPPASSVSPSSACSCSPNVGR